jgi:hypothetical protein
MHQLPEFMQQATHTPFYVLMWIISLILQATLFVSLFSRRLAGQTSFFANFIAFYFVRSLLLFLLLNHISVSAYSQLYHLFLWIEMFVQFCMAAGLTHWLVTLHGGWISRNIVVPIVMVGISGIGTYLITLWTPHGDIPIDRSSIFFSIYMICFWLWTFALRERIDNPIVLTQGFAIYGLINIVANIGRVRAASSNHFARYGAWTYVLGGAYLVVVIFWLYSLKPRDEKAAQTRLRTTI